MQACIHVCGIKQKNAHIYAVCMYIPYRVLCTVHTCDVGDEFEVCEIAYDWNRAELRYCPDSDCVVCCWQQRSGIELSGRLWQSYIVKNFFILFQYDQLVE